MVNSRGKKRIPNKYTLQQVVRTQDALFLDFIEVGEMAERLAMYSVESEGPDDARRRTES